MNLQQISTTISNSAKAQLNHLNSSQLGARLHETSTLTSFTQNQLDRLSPQTFDNAQKINQIVQEQSSDEQKELKDVQLIFPQRKLTSDRKIIAYFNEFVCNNSLNSIPYENKSPCQKQLFPNPLSKFTKLSKALQKIKQNIQKSLPTKDLQKQISIKTTISHHLKQFQQSHKQGIQKILIHSKKIKKINYFTSDLIVHNVSASTNCQICELQLHLLEYKISIIILNQPMNNPLAQMIENSQSGGSGTVYFAKSLDQEIAIKSIPLPKKYFINQGYSDKISKISSILKQFFFVTLFSELQIGPKAQTLAGFDLIMYNDSLIFATQICSQVSFQEINKLQLHKSLFQMHVLQVIHRDIKPQNIMFSKAYQKPVFIDFGCTVVIRQHLGEKSWSKFVGTIDYCCEEVKSLGIDGPGQVDLYFNDIYALKSSLGEMSKKKDCFENLDLMMEIFSQNYKFSSQLVQSSEYPMFVLFALKHSLYVSDFERFKFLWKDLRIKHQNLKQQMEKQILEFLSEVKHSNELKELYSKQLDQGTKDLQVFNEMRKALSPESNKFEKYLCNFLSKQILFEQFTAIYQNIGIELSAQNQEIKQWRRLISSRQNIESFIWQVKFNYYKEDFFASSDFNPVTQNQKDQVHETIVKLCFAVANFTSLSHNKYQTTIETKTQACSLALNIIEIYLKNKARKFKPIFECKDHKYSPIAKFHEFYLLWIIQEVGLIEKSTQICNSVLTLIIIGYPFHQNKFYLEMVHGILSSAIEKFEGSGSFSEEQKVDKLITFWTLELILKITQQLNSNKQQQAQSVLIQHGQLQQSTVKLKKTFLSFYHQQTNEFSMLHCLFQQHILLGKSVDKQEVQELIKSQKFKNLTKGKNEYKTLWSILCCYLLISSKQKAIQGFKLSLQKIESEMIFSKQNGRDLLPFLWLLSIGVQQNKGFKTRVFDRIEGIIKCQELSKGLWPKLREQRIQQSKKQQRENQLLQNSIDDAKERMI